MTVTQLHMHAVNQNKNMTISNVDKDVEPKKLWYPWWEGKGTVTGRGFYRPALLSLVTLLTHMEPLFFEAQKTTEY
jgi:hypothetical protein